MKVLQIMAGAEFGGAEAFFVRLAIALNRTGLEQKVVIRKNPARAALLRHGEVEPIELPFGGRMDFSTTRALKREIKEFQPDVVLTWMNRATSMCPKGDFVHAARLGGYYDLKYYAACDHLIGNTQDIVEYLVEHDWPAEKAHYLPNFVFDEDAEPLTRREFYTPNDVPLIVALGRLHENKAFDVLLSALTRVPNAYLWLAGDGPLKEELQKQAEVLGIKPRVRFLGWRDDTAALLKTADLFVCPSRHEPLGNVVIEAWAQGLPVVAADSMGPGTLIENMESGVLVPIDDEILMARAIRGVLDDEDLARRIAENGYQTYQDNFTEAGVVEQYLEFFKKVAG
ncbi:glycosyltransferase [Rhodospirillales bacterium]|jgi:glycosyltransferase involved in cell wall biosynthesis|nr:glycosyltransferase [Rhodospirillales bacterium]MDC1213363.1 glycosyltransferase [Rhodospirillales bacterium]